MEELGVNDDEWDYLPGTWNVFENEHGWRVSLDVLRLPGRWDVERRKEYAATLLYALNHGQPSETTRLDEPSKDAEVFEP